jgi:hypothetical protein
MRCWIVVVSKERRCLDAKAAGELADVMELEGALIWTFLHEQGEPAVVVSPAVAIDDAEGW